MLIFPFPGSFSQSPSPMIDPPEKQDIFNGFNNIECDLVEYSWCNTCDTACHFPRSKWQWSLHGFCCPLKKKLLGKKNLGFYGMVLGPSSEFSLVLLEMSENWKRQKSSFQNDLWWQYFSTFKFKILGVSKLEKRTFATTKFTNRKQICLQFPQDLHFKSHQVVCVQAEITRGTRQRLQ